MHACPVCGYPKLTEPPRSPAGGGSYEICPSCGFQFGVDDDDRGKSYEEVRQAWMAGGMRWSSKGIPAPKGWNAKGQLATVSSAAKPVGKTAKKTAKKAARAVTKKAPKKPSKAIPARSKKAVQAAKKKPRRRR